MRKAGFEIWNQVRLNLACSAPLADPEVGTGGPDTPGKSQVAIGLLRNSGKDPLEKYILYCYNNLCQYLNVLLHYIYLTLKIINNDLMYQKLTYK